MVGVSSHSWKKKTALKKAQQELNLPEHSLIRISNKIGFKEKKYWEDVGIEQSVLKFYLKTRRPVNWSLLGRTDVLKSINNILGPLQEFTDALPSEAYVRV